MTALFKHFEMPILILINKHSSRRPKRQPELNLNLKTEPEKLSQKMSEYKAKAAEFKTKSLRFWLKTSSAIPEKRSRNDEEAKTNAQ